MTVEELVKKQIRSIKILDGNTEIHAMYLSVEFQGKEVWHCGSDDTVWLISGARHQAKKIVQRLRKQAQLPALKMSDIADFKIGAA